MHSEKEKRLLMLQRLACADEQYAAMQREHRELDRMFQAVMEELTPRQRSVVGDYVGLIAMMGNRMTLIACGEMDFVTNG